MLHPRNRFERNPYFHFHPIHSTFALISVLVFMGLLAYLLSWIR